MIHPSLKPRIRTFLRGGIPPATVAKMFGVPVGDVDTLKIPPRVEQPSPKVMRPNGRGRNGQTPSPEEIEQWRRMAQEGATDRQIALRFKRSLSTIHRHLNDPALSLSNAIPRLPYCVTSNERKLWAKQFRQGMTAHEIALAANRADETVRIHLRKMGFKIPRKGKRQGHRQPGNLFLR